MAWSRKKTEGILVFSLILSIACLVVSLVLLLGSADDKDDYKLFIYLCGTSYLTGLGCITLRLLKKKLVLLHALIHVVVIIFMVYGLDDTFQNISDEKYSEAFHARTISLFTFVIYALQILLALHLVVFRAGRNPNQKAFRAGIHAFIGALTFFVCIMDGILTAQRMAFDTENESEGSAQMGIVILLLYGTFTWYIILNPYFDWRRLNAMARTQRIKKAKLGKTTAKPKPPSRITSKSSIKSTGRPRFEN